MPFLAPLALDYEADAVPLTPKGNATERHLCLAYARKAAKDFPEESALAPLSGVTNWECLHRISRTCRMGAV